MFCHVLVAATAAATATATAVSLFPNINDVRKKIRHFISQSKSNRYQTNNNIS